MDKLYINIRKRREQLGLSQDDLARLAGYTSRSSIAKIESGLVDLSLPKLEAISRALNTKPTTLLEWDITPEDIEEFHDSVDFLEKELSTADKLQMVLSEDEIIGDHKYSDDELREILEFARFKAGVR